MPGALHAADQPRCERVGHGGDLLQLDGDLRRDRRVALRRQRGDRIGAEGDRELVGRHTDKTRGRPAIFPD